MRQCEWCHRDYPEVAGADTQVCPHCGAEADSPRVDTARRALPRDATAAATTGFRLFGHHYPQLLALWVPAILVDAGASFLLEHYAQSSGMPADITAMTAGDQLRFLGVATPLVFLVFTVKFASWAFVAGYLGDLRRDDDRDRFRGLARRLPAVIGLGLMLTLAYLGGLALFIVPFLVFFHWFLYAPAAFADGENTGGAFEASRRFAKEHRTFGFTTLVLFVLFLAWLVLGVVGGSIQTALAAAGLTDPRILAAVGPLVNGLLGPLAPALAAGYWFLGARADAAAPPAPDASPRERHRTTKCPQCGTLVPYTATGEPVDVTCPVCGRSGRVL